MPPTAAVNAEVPLPLTSPVRVPAPVPPLPTASVPTVSESAMPSEEVAETPVPPEETESGVASVKAPAEENDDVAVAPKYALEKTENRVDDAFPNCCRFDQEFTVVVPKESEIAFVERVNG